MNFRIQHLQWAGSLGVVAVCVAMAIITTVPKLSDYVDAQRTMSEFSKLNAVLTAAYAVSAERGPANNFMSATGAARDEYRDALVAARARTDASLSKVADLLPRDAAPSSEAVADFEMAKALLAKGRHDVDAAKIDSDRGKGVEVAAAIEAMFSAADKMQDLGNDVGRTVIASDPAVGVDVISATAASGLREHAGRLGSYVVMLLVSGSGTGSPYLTAFHSEMARVHDLYALLSNYASAAVSRNEVSSALLAVQKSYFGGSLVYASRVVDGLDTGRVPSSTDFTISYVPGMMATDTLRSAILSNGMRTASDSQANALRTVLVSFLLSATAIAVMIGVAWTAHRVLFQPLLLVRLQIDEIAAGKVADDSETVHRAGGVEIREIIKGLAFLRGQLRRKNELEAERQAMADELKRQSNTDALTGLLNRRALGDRVEALFSKRELQGAGVGVIIFDVDHFKSINDRYGHAVGDRVLARIAELLTLELRSDDCFARYGGEEFVVVLRNVVEAETRLAAESLRLRLNGAMLKEIPGGVTASFGTVWSGPDMEAGWEEVIRIADERLYRAKHSGRNMVCAADPEQIVSDSIVPLRWVSPKA
jgi:diguanylate cyclase (GGDEF)-like protein